MSFSSSFLNYFRMNYPMNIALLGAFSSLSYLFCNMYGSKIKKTVMDINWFTAINFTQRSKSIVSNREKNIKSVQFKEPERLILISKQKFYYEIVQYLYINHKDKLNHFTYNEEKIYSYSEWRARKKERPAKMKVLLPTDCNFKIEYKMNDIVYDITIKVDIEKDTKGDLVTLMEIHDC